MTAQTHGEDYFDHYEALKRQLPAGAVVRDTHDLHRQLRSEAQKAEALRIGRVEFQSAGATRKR